MHYYDGLNDWYKFKATKKRNYWIVVGVSPNALVNKGTTISVYKGSSKKPVFTRTLSAGKGEYITKGYNLKLPKGTYYVKIHSKSKYSNASTHIAVYLKKPNLGA